MAFDFFSHHLLNLFRYTIPIDHIGFAFEVMKEENESEVTGKPEDGKIIEVLCHVLHDIVRGYLLTLILVEIKSIKSICHR